MRDLVPFFITQNYSKDLKEGKFRAAVLFVDITGFTQMTKRLMEKGTEGIEILTLTINDVFTPAITAVRARGGFISVFGGDAFYSLFNSKTIGFKQNALSAAQEITRLFSEFGIKKTGAGVFELSVKTGLSMGEIEWGIIQNPHQNTYYFKGDPLDSASNIQRYCAKNHVVVDKNFVDSFRNRKRFSPVGEGAFTPDFTANPPNSTTQLVKRRNAKQKEFMPATLLDGSVKSEFREVVSIFISFADSPLFREKISKVIDIVNETGGYFNRVSYGDKGGFILVFYGAPEGRELLCERAAKMALSVAAIPHFMICAGITFGMCFSGFTGTEERAEYTCQGERVNLAARLMTLKKDNLPPEPRILTDYVVKEKLSYSFSFEFVCDSVLKGFDDPVPVFCLKGEKTMSQILRGEAVGRERHFEKASEVFNKTIESGVFGGILKIEGEAGTGKSFFVAELVKRHPSFNWIFMPCDQIFKYSLNPVKHFLNLFFGFGEKAAENDKISSAKEKLVKIFSGEDFLDSGEIDVMLFFLCQVAGLKYEDPNFASLDQKNRKDMILHYTKLFIKTLSKKKPTIVFFDDFHWIDDDTLDLAKSLCHGTEKNPLILVTASRRAESGENIFQDARVSEISLKPFNREDSFELAKKILKTEDIPQPTLEFIFDRSEGNPFYIEQTIRFLLENGYFDLDFRLSSDASFIPSGIRSIIISRFDRFGRDLKNAMIRASVLGREFSTEILAKMISAKNIERILGEGEKNVVWMPQGTGLYSFSHALIRDSVYEMQLKSELRILHRDAARAYENLPEDYKEKNTGIIAFHYDLSDDKDKAPVYLKKAFLLAQKSFSTIDSLRFCEALDKYLEQGKEKLENSIKRIRLISVTGKLEKAEEIAQKTLADCEDEISLAAECLISLCEITLKLFKMDKNLEYLKKLDVLSEKLEDKKIRTELFKLYGFYWHSHEDEKKAVVYFQKALNLTRITKDKKAEAKCLSDISVFCGREIGLEKVLDYLFEALKIAEETGDLRTLEIILSNLGLSYAEIYLDIENSFIYYQKGIEICRRTGNISALMNNLNNLATIYLAKGEKKTAEELLKTSLDMAAESGHKLATVNAYCNLSVFYRNLRKFRSALDCIKRAEKIIENTPMKEYLLAVKKDRFEIYAYTKDALMAKNALDDINSLHRKINGGEDLPDLVFYELRVKFLQTGDKKILTEMEKEAEKTPLKSRKAHTHYIIWKTSDSPESAEISLNLYRELIQEPPKDFKDIYWVIRKKELENYFRDMRES
ncbi:AAA family ATPase [candidate division WOR-3 bacterium]|nr:AAA family ATPase [candidate division WOR-3 bacterium]